MFRARGVRGPDEIRFHRRRRLPVGRRFSIARRLHRLRLFPRQNRHGRDFVRRRTVVLLVSRLRHSTDDRWWSQIFHISGRVHIGHVERLRQYNQYLRTRFAYYQ